MEILDLFANLFLASPTESLCDVFNYWDSILYLYNKSSRAFLLRLVDFDQFYILIRLK